MAVITVSDLQEYLGIDIVDAQITANLTRARDAAERWLYAGVSQNFDETDPRAVELALAYGADMYNSRVVNGVPGSNVRKMMRDFTLQLKIEGVVEDG